MENSTQNIADLLNIILEEEIYLYLKDDIQIQIFTNKNLPNSKDDSKLMDYHIELNDYKVDINSKKIKIIRKKSYYQDMFIILFISLICLLAVNNLVLGSDISFKYIIKGSLCIFILYGTTKIWIKKFKLVNLMDKTVIKHFK